MTPLGDKNIVELKNAVEMVNWSIIEHLDVYYPISILRSGGSNFLSRRWSRRGRWGGESWRRRRRDRELGLATTTA